METGQMKVEDLRADFARDRRRAWVRVLLRPESRRKARLWSAQIVVGPRPDGWEPRTWVFPECTFISADFHASDIASAFVAGSPQELRFGSIRASFTLDQGASWLRHPSRQSYGDIELPWPSRTAQLSLALPDLNSPNAYMVGKSGPSFPSFGGAFAAFFFDQWAQTGAGSPVLNQVVVRTVDGRARITRVVVHAASLDVWVSGRAVRGCRLELNSTMTRLETVVERSGKLSLPLPTGLGQDAWLWLKNDVTWLDYRALTPWGGRQSPDVEVERPEDPVADISALATQGESSYLEYKVTLPDDTSESKRKMLKTVVAFANGDGGTILFGVEGDDDVGRIVGLDGRAAALQRRLNDLVRDRVMPSPTVHVAGRNVNGKFVIRLDVERRDGMLYALVLDANKPEYYVRRNGSTYYARPEELAQVIASASQIPSSGISRLL